MGKINSYIEGVQLSRADWLELKNEFKEGIKSHFFPEFMNCKEVSVATEDESSSKVEKTESVSVATISQCPHCHCMTKNICGKCGGTK